MMINLEFLIISLNILSFSVFLVDHMKEIHLSTSKSSPVLPYSTSLGRIYSK